MEALKASTGVLSISFISPIRSLRNKVSVLVSFNCSSGSCSHIHFGPLNHLDFLLNSDRSFPQVPSSAGFGGPGQCFP